LRLFITGAYGFIGGSLMRALAQEHEIVALSPATEFDADIEACGATCIRGTPAFVTSHLLHGVDVVISCGSRATDWINDPKAWQQEATEIHHLLDAAKQSDVKRFIHIGVDSALYDGKDILDADEDTPLCPDSPFPFVATNACIEEAVLAANSPDMTSVVLRVHITWGPGDTKMVEALRRMIETNSFVWVDKGRARICTTHIDNLAHALKLALTKGEGAYFITDHGNTTHYEFLTQLAASQGIKLPETSIPAWSSRVVAYFIAALWRLLGRNDAPFFNVFLVSYVSRHRTSSHAKAAREFGYAPIISREQGLAQLHTNG